MFCIGLGNFTKILFRKVNRNQIWGYDFYLATAFYNLITFLDLKRTGDPNIKQK